MKTAAVPPEGGAQPRGDQGRLVRRERAAPQPEVIRAMFCGIVHVCEGPRAWLRLAPELQRAVFVRRPALRHQARPGHARRGRDLWGRMGKMAERKCQSMHG